MSGGIDYHNNSNYYRWWNSQHLWKMVNVPKERKTYCKKCSKHNLHKVTQYKAGKASNFAQVCWSFLVFLIMFFNGQRMQNMTSCQNSLPWLWCIASTSWSKRFASCCIYRVVVVLLFILYFQSTWSSSKQWRTMFE